MTTFAPAEMEIQRSLVLIIELELDRIGVPRVCRHCPGPSEASSPEPETGAQINRERGRGNIQVQDSAHLASDETKIIVDAFCWKGKIFTILLLYVFVKFLIFLNLKL